MRYIYTKKEFPGSNPIASALVVVAGALVIAASIVIGFFALIALGALILVSAAIIGLRGWWLRRRMGTVGGARTVGDRSASRRDVIEGEFRVIREDRDEA